MRTFFRDSDFRDYLLFLSEELTRAAVAIWSYCLMPNHVHLILVPAQAKGLGLGVGEAHRRYTTLVNEREGWQGYLWQGRFRSCPMDEAHLLMAARYVEMNPVRAGLVASPKSYPWSSAKAHLQGRDDGVVQTQPLLSRMPDWGRFLSGPEDEDAARRIRANEKTGRPLGAEEFIRDLENRLRIPLLKRRAGRKPSRSAEGAPGTK